MSRILGIGALYEDTILGVDRLEEDAKKHASSKDVRIGGNILNTFDVLAEAPALSDAGAKIEVEFLGPVGTRDSCQ